MPAKKSGRQTVPRKPARGKSLSIKNKSTYEINQTTESYEEMMINSILSGGSKGKSTEYSILLNSILSALTPGMRDLHYKSGMSVGRALYQALRKRKRYSLYEESIQDLVSFLEGAGFSGITYSISPDRIDINFNNRDNSYLGANIHLFEAGIMCGFISAAKHQHTRVDEVSCSNNGFDSCHFITSPVRSDRRGADGKEMLGLFATSVERSIEERKDGKKSFAEEYSALSSMTSLRHDYYEHMGKVMHHLGCYICAGLDLGPRSGIAMERLYRMLDLGDLTVKSIKPVSVQIRFPMLKAKKEFVDISIAFLDGILSGIVKDGVKINMSVRNHNGSYVLLANEAKSKG